jgi:hypothetical protein
MREVGFLLLALWGCSGESVNGFEATDDPQAGETGTGGSAAGAGGSAGSLQGGTAGIGSSGGMAGAQAGGSGSAAAGSAGTAGSAGAGGEPVAGAAGMSGTAGETAGTAGTAGSGGIGAEGGTSGAAGSAGESGSSGGTGGAVDPLEPVPSEGCPGFFDYFVPPGTCVWIHGRFTLQGVDTCGVPTEDNCATATVAPNSDGAWVRVSGTVGVSSPNGVEVTRYPELEAGDSCPKQCEAQ